MKTKIIIGGLLVIALIAISVKAGIAYRVDSTQIYSSAQEVLGVQTYKFVDSNVTCYGQIAKNNNVVTSQSLSCVK